jgi:hypothetical protein
MSEQPPLPEDGAQLDNHPAQPFLPPELPDAEATRMQSVDDRTRDMAPLKDARLHQSEKAKRGQRPVNYSAKRPRQTTPPPHFMERGAQSGNISSSLRLPAWSVFLTLFMVCGAVSCVVVAVLGLGGRTAPNNPPRFVIITAQPSATVAIGVPSLLATPTLPPEFQNQGAAPIALSGPTLPPVIFTATPTPAPQITRGVVVQVIGDRGIRIRQSPGIDDTVNIVLDIADPGEQFTVLDGPQDAAGLKWWQITNGVVTGWAAQNDGTTDLLAVSVP